MELDFSLTRRGLLRLPHVTIGLLLAGDFLAGKTDSPQLFMILQQNYKQSYVLIVLRVFLIVEHVPDVRTSSQIRKSPTFL